MNRKKTNIIYWISTGLFAAFMLMSAIPDVVNHPMAVEIIHKHLGYPVYFLQFVGTAKILGAAAVLVPGFPRLKEWAYAGLAFDLIAALYSHISVGDPFGQWAIIFLPAALLIISYIFHHKKLKSDSPGRF